MDGALTAEERRLLASALKLEVLPGSRWPRVATCLLVRGIDADPVAELAGLSAKESPWVLDPLIAQTVALLDLPAVGVEEAGDVLAPALGRLAGPLTDESDRRVVLLLAALAVSWDYPSGLLREAWELAEYLDCTCHEGSRERAAAAALEERLRSSVVHGVDEGLLEAALGP